MPTDTTLATGEMAEEQPDPATIQRPEPHPSGGKQDDSQSPFDSKQP